MRVFLLNSKILSEINRKEEITDDTYLITDQEADLIQQNLDINGHFWIDENKQLRLSGKAPNDYLDWDDVTHAWVVNPVKLEQWIVDEKIRLWEEIKKERSRVLQSGVKMVVNGTPKWFHTDMESQQSYDRAISHLKRHEGKSISWKTMDNTFVDLTLSDLNTLIDHIFVVGQRVFQIAEGKKQKLNALTDPQLISNFNVKEDWIEVYGG